MFPNTKREMPREAFFAKLQEFDYQAKNLEELATCLSDSRVNAK